MITTQKIVTGEFAVLWNGKPTEYRIFNACMGMSGRGGNSYAIKKPDGSHRMVGSLASCKKSLALTFRNNPPTH
jgi:hypothetical protein